MTTETVTTEPQRLTKAQIAELNILARPPESLWRDAWRRLLRNRLAVAGAIFIIIISLAALFADDWFIRALPWVERTQSHQIVAPYHYKVVPDRTRTREAPSGEHWFGTDQQGRDVFSRVIYGGQVSLSIGLIGSLVIMTFGLAYGSISGYFGGRVDNVLMRIVDVLYAFPTLLFVILMQVLLIDGFHWPPFLAMVVGISGVSWMGTARLVRGQFLSIREKEYVEAARMIGTKPLGMITRHMLPNSLGPIIVSLTLGIPSLIMFEATLSFIGLGLPPPRPTWGQMLNEGWKAMRTSWWLVVFPALALSLTMLAFNFLGDGLRDALDPRMKGTQ
jgi:oligopeptide transport system permease protein